MAAAECVESQEIMVMEGIGKERDYGRLIPGQLLQEAKIKY